MKKRTYFICLGIIIAAIALGLYLGLVSGNPAVPAAISGKAALVALEITIVLSAILFAGAMTFFFNGGYGGGIHTCENGSARVSFMQFDTITRGQALSYDAYLIRDPAHRTTDDFWGLDRLFAKGHETKDFPVAFGAAMGVIVVLLVSLYAAFSFYYRRKYEA